MAEERSGGSSAKRGVEGGAASESAAKRVCKDGEDLEEMSPDEKRWVQWQHQRGEVQLGAVEVFEAPLYRECLSFSNDPTPRARPLQVDTLLQEWFVEPVPDALICCVCTEVVRDPPNLETCGHAVCRECLKKHRRRSTDCPVCRQSFANSILASQPFVQNMVWQLRVRCVHHDKGCEWQDQLGTNSRNLIAHDAVCSFKEFKCNLCDKSCIGDEKMDHAKRCPMRRVECASCELQVLFCNLKDHQPLVKSSVLMDLTGDEEMVASAASNEVQPLLKPTIPPCISSEICPRGCEDPRQRGRVLVYPRSQREAHERICTEQPVKCSLCFPVHLVSPRHLTAHIGTVMNDPQRREFAQRQIAQSLRHTTNIQA